jgi:hypothetical protein
MPTAEVNARHFDYWRQHATTKPPNLLVCC